MAQISEKAYNFHDFDVTPISEKSFRDFERAFNSVWHISKGNRRKLLMRRKRREKRGYRSIMNYIRRHKHKGYFIKPWADENPSLTIK